MRKITLFAVIMLFATTSQLIAVTKGGSGRRASGDKKTGSMNVQVREAIVRATPNYMGASTGKVVYGGQVNVVSEEGNWYKIENPAGWVPKSAITKHKIAVNPDQKFTSMETKHDEVALAGKGFNPQVEAQYKKDNASLAAAYADVDKIEKLTASEAELETFQATGKLKPR